jgi:hypothetical protein
MLKKALKFILIILFIPVVIAGTKAFLKTLDNLNLFSISLFLLIGGFFIYPIFHIVCFKPMYLYIWGHEIVHVLATWLCGGKVTSFHVSRDGGRVTTTKTNLFIVLSPYFVPIHTILLVLAYWGLSQFFDLSRFSQEFVFLIGFTISFHIFMTIEVMKMRQPDMMKAGYIFSAMFVYLCNLCVVIFGLSLMFSNISFLYFFKKMALYTKDIYIEIFNVFIK